MSVKFNNSSLEDRHNDTYLFSSLVVITTKSSPVPTMYVAGTYLCQTFGIVIYLWCVMVYKLYLNKKNKEQTAIHVAAAKCKMNKKMPGLSTGCKTINHMSALSA